MLKISKNWFLENIKKLDRNVKNWSGHLKPGKKMGHLKPGKKT
jgi:hypothetical protein